MSIKSNTGKYKQKYIQVYIQILLRWKGVIRNINTNTNVIANKIQIQTQIQKDKNKNKWRCSIKMRAAFQVGSRCRKSKYNQKYKNIITNTIEREIQNIIKIQFKEKKIQKQMEMFNQDERSI